MRPVAQGPLVKIAFLLLSYVRMILPPFVVVQRLAFLTPNARFQALGMAGARHERRLFPVGCKPLFGKPV
jgi:hypothetical protein